MAAPLGRSLYSQVAPGLIIGNLESVVDCIACYTANIDKAPLTDVTAIINLSTIEIAGTHRDPRNPLHVRVPEDIQYISQSQTPEEPYDGSFERVDTAMMKVVELLLAPMIRNGHTILLVCESGRRVSAMVAVLYLVTVQGGDSQKIYDNVSYAHTTAAERARHSRIHAENESRRWDTKPDEPSPAQAATLRADKTFYDDLQQTRICLSPQYKKLLLYHIQ